MIASIYLKYLEKFMPKLQTLIEKINGKRKQTLTYLHQTMLRKEYAPDNKWESTSVNTTYVMADMVAMDSELPIKKRDAISSANGKLPKIGMAKNLRESDMTAIRIMEAQGGQAQRIAAKLAQDPVACATGIDERNEYNFLTAFCEGVVGIKTTNDEGVAELLRLNYNYPDANKYGATEKGVISIDDMKKVIDAASEDGNTVTHVAISKTTYDALRQTREARELVANYEGRDFSDTSSLPVPTPTRFNAAFMDETGADFNVINRSCVIEANGTRKSIKPWNDNRVIFYCSDEVGTLVYGRLAEQDNPVDGVQYSTVDQYKLIARFRETNPLRECTTSQAFVAPVIEDVDTIYVLDLTESQEVDATAEAEDTSDIYVTVWGNKYKKTDFVAAYTAQTGKALASTATDAKIIAAVNKLSNADEDTLKASLVSKIVTA